MRKVILAKTKVNSEAVKIRKCLRFFNKKGG
jgi:hypothetical protein